jgi:fibro-slime domain-containing protein
LSFGILAFSCASLANAATISLTGTIRDFNDSHPDFENVLGIDPGIVQNTLGSDGKPVYAGQAGNPTTHGQAAFDQWYRDAPGVNLSAQHSITLDNTLTPDPRIYTYSNHAFFPINGMLFGNQGRTNNYHFTFELHSDFVYSGGEVLTFTGDDDLWVFINNRLALELSGVHTTISESINLDTVAEMLDINPGNQYRFDLFFAERHTISSDFRIDTSIALNPQATPETGTVLLLGSGLSLLAVFRQKLVR